MKKKNSPIIYIFLPVMILYALGNLLSVFSSQISLVYVILAYEGPGKIAMDTLMERAEAFITGIEFLYANATIRGVVAIAVFVYWYKRILQSEKSGDKREIVELNKKPKIAIIPAIVLVAVGCRFVGVFVLNFMISVFPTWLVTYKNVLDTMGLSLSGGNENAPIIMILYTVLIAPIMEEYVFRGVSLKYALKNFGIIGANIVCALLFAIMHGNMLQGTYTFLFGMVLGFIVSRTGRIWIAIVIHIIFNAISMFVPDLIYLGNNAIATFAVLFTSLVSVYVGLMMMDRIYPTIEK